MSTKHDVQVGQLVQQYLTELTTDEIKLRSKDNKVLMQRMFLAAKIHEGVGWIVMLVPYLLVFIVRIVAAPFVLLKAGIQYPIAKYLRAHEEELISYEAMNKALFISTSDRPEAVFLRLLLETKKNAKSE